MKSPIGIFDSGIGGLSILEKLKEKLPHENFIYLADNLNCPYGNKTKEDGDIINSIEKSVRLKTGRIRASGSTFYVSRRETDGYDF